MKRYIGISMMLFAMAGCSTTYRAEVEATGGWTGGVSSTTSTRSVSGSGNQTIDLGETTPQCVSVQKTGISGTLRLKIIKTEEGWFSDDETTQVDVATAASYGTVSGCTE